MLWKSAFIRSLKLTVDTCVRSLRSLAYRALDGSGFEHPLSRSLDGTLFGNGDDAERLWAELASNISKILA